MIKLVRKSSVDGRAAERSSWGGVGSGCFLFFFHLLLVDFLVLFVEVLKVGEAGDERALRASLFAAGASVGRFFKNLFMAALSRLKSVHGPKQL